MNRHASTTRLVTCLVLVLLAGYVACCVGLRERATETVTVSDANEPNECLWLEVELVDGDRP